MKVIVQVVEAIGVLIPDLTTLGLIVPVFFGLYRCAITLGLPGSRDINAALLIALFLGYVLTVALNMASAATLPARPSPVPFSPRDPRREELPRESRSEAVKTQFVREGIEIRQETGFLREVQE